MALVDYDSSSGSASDLITTGDDDQHLSKRRRCETSVTDDEKSDGKADEAEMPPLPAAFHDLYASTVRQSVVDDPSLHQGRKRQTPHVPGKWPSHIYIEWHPTHAQHAELIKLIDGVREQLNGQTKLHQFLTSDLGAPLSLHISLSRPLSLTTARKDAFLEEAASAIRGCGIKPFCISPKTLTWFKSPESARSFLILRVESETKQQNIINTELITLLDRCNSIARKHDQATLYQRGREDQLAGAAFHISIGWTLDPIDEQQSLQALHIFEEQQYDNIQNWKIDVSGVKVKIGNVVSHVPLLGTNGRKQVAETRDGLF